MAEHVRRGGIHLHSHNLLTAGVTSETVPTNPLLSQLALDPQSSTPISAHGPPFGQDSNIAEGALVVRQPAGPTVPHMPLFDLNHGTLARPLEGVAEAAVPTEAEAARTRRGLSPFLLERNRWTE